MIPSSRTAPPELPPRQDSEELFLELYGELRRLAQAGLARERPGQTMQATALVHEAYLRLVRDHGWSLGPSVDPRLLLWRVAEVMRTILVDRARAKGALKRGRDWGRLSLDSVCLEAPEVGPELLELHEALEELRGMGKGGHVRLVELRFFASLSIDDAAEVLEISPATAKRHWKFARTWLLQRLQGGCLEPTSRESIDS